MNPRVFGAFIIGIALIAGAYVISDFGGRSELAVNTDPSAGVVVGKAPTRSYISTRDQNGDGVPDWQEALRSTEPVFIDQATGTYEIPETITDEFAVNFFESYVRAKGYGAFGDSQEELIDNSINDLQAATQDELIKPDAVTTIIPATPENLRAYGNALASVILNGKVSNPKNEAVITLEAVRSQDESKLADLDERIAIYEMYVDESLNIPVPEGYLKAHINLVSAYNFILNDIRGMRAAFSDPLLALVRIQRYQEDVEALLITLETLYSMLESDGTEWTEQDLVSQIRHID